MKLASFAVAAVLAIPAAAHAGAKVKAHLECSLDGGAKIGKGEKVPLDKDIACIVVLDGHQTPPPGATAQLWITEKRGDGPFNTQGVQAQPVGEGDMNYFQPDGEFHHGQDYQKCNGFTVHANIVTDEGPLWEGSLAIAAKCEKPKKLKAELSCFMTDGDTIFNWPGNGEKMKPRMEGELNCSIVSKTAPADGTHGVFVITHDDGTVPPTRTTEFTRYPGDKGSYYFQAVFREDDYHACSNFALQATVVDANGQTLWGGKQKFKQTCPD